MGNPDGQLGKISDFFEVIARNFDEMFKIPCKKVRKISQDWPSSILMGLWVSESDPDRGIMRTVEVV